jgi:hypothetical protein
MKCGRECWTIPRGRKSDFTAVFCGLALLKRMSDFALFVVLLALSRGVVLFKKEPSFPNWRSLIVMLILFE